MATPEVESKFEKCEAKPVDNGNLAAESIVDNDQPRAATVDTASEHLCAMEIVERGTAETTLNPETGLPVVTGDALKQSAIALNDALHPGIFGTPDFEKVRTILDAYSPDDRKRLEAAYNGLVDAEPLRDELKAAFVLFPDKYREAESILDRTGETNIIGNMTVALETANGISPDPAKAGEQLIAVVSKLEDIDLQAAITQWNERYGSEFGGSFETAIKNSNLSEEDKHLLLTFYDQGKDKRTASDVKLAGEYLLEQYNNEWTSNRSAEFLDRFQAVIGGQSQAAIDARRSLRADSAWTASYNDAFAPSGIVFESEKARLARAQDILTEGETSVASIVASDMQTGEESWNAIFDGDWTSQNPEHVDKVLSGASTRARDSFVEGRKLAGADYETLTPDQKEQVDYYKKMDAVFKARGTDAQQIIWADQLAHGRKTIVSQLLELKKEGGHTTDALVNAVEKMSPEDWQLIRPVDGKQSDYMTQLKATIATFATPAEQTRLFGMLDSRSTAESFEKATEVKRTIADQFSDLSGDEPGTRKAIARAVMAMTGEDVQTYLNDPAIRSRIDSVVFPDLTTYKSSDNNSSAEDRAALLLAQTLLTQATADGKAPVVEGNQIAATAKAMMEGANLGESQAEMKARMQSLYTLMSDPAILAKLKATDALLHTADESKISSADLGLYAALEKLDPSGEAFKQMLQTGQIDIGTQVSYGGRLETGSIYSQHLRLSPERQERLENHLTDDQKQIIEYVREQGGRTDFVDEFRSYVIGVNAPAEGDNGVQGYRHFVDKLRDMSPEQRTALFAEYDKKYEGNALEEFKAALARKDTPTGGYEAVVAKLIETNFQPNPAIDARLAVLDGKTDVSGLTSQLAKMDATQKKTFVDQYNTWFESDAASDVLGLVENNYSESIKLGNLLRPSGSDPFQTYLDRLRRFDTTGMDPDGTKEAVRLALESNSDLILAYESKKDLLPPEMVKAMDAYFEAAVMDNRQSREDAAQDIKQKFQILTAVVAVASIPLHGGAGFAALGVAGGVSLTSAKLQYDALGSGMITEAQARDIMVTAGIDAGLTLAPGVAYGFAKYLNASRPVAVESKILARADDADSAVVVTAPDDALTLSRVETQVDNSVIVAPVDEQAELLAAARVEKFPGKTADDVSDVPPVAQTVARTTPDEVIAAKPVEAIATDEVAAVKTVDALVPDEVKAVDAVVPDEVRAVDAVVPDEIKVVDTVVPDEIKAVEAVVPEEAASLAAAAEAERLRKLMTFEPVVADAISVGGRLVAPAIVLDKAADIVSDLQEQPEPQPVVDQTPQPSQQLIDLATVKRGEGPWQSAERILAADGKRHGVDEVRALTKAFQAVFKAENGGNGDMGGLKVRHNFVTKDNFDDLIAACNNAEVKAILLNMAQGAPVS